jgi:hypothetical protein
MTTSDGSSLSPPILSVCPLLVSNWLHPVCLTVGQRAWHHPVPSWVVPGWRGQLNSLVCTSICFDWYSLGFWWWRLRSVGGWVAFLVVVIASSGRLLCNDIVSGLVFKGLPSHFFSFSIYFEIDKYYTVWTGPNQAHPVQDCQAGAQTSSTFLLDRTALSPTPGQVCPDWWNHWVMMAMVYWPWWWERWW